MDKEQLRKRIDELEELLPETAGFRDYNIRQKIVRLTQLYDDLYGE